MNLLKRDDEKKNKYNKCSFFIPYASKGNVQNKFQSANNINEMNKNDKIVASA